MPAEDRSIQLSLKGKAEIISSIPHSSWVVSIIVLFLHIEANTDNTSSKSTLAMHQTFTNCTRAHQVML